MSDETSPLKAERRAAKCELAAGVGRISSRLMHHEIRDALCECRACAGRGSWCSIMVVHCGNRAATNVEVSRHLYGGY